MVRAGTLCEVKITGGFFPYSCRARSKPVFNFSAKAWISEGWSCQDSTKSKLILQSAQRSELRYSPTLVLEFCGARHITIAWVTPLACIRCSVSEMNGCQLRIPT